MAGREPIGRSAALDQVPMRAWANEAPSKAREGERVTEPLSPIPVRAWLKNRESEFQADGEALAWTSTQVRIRYIDLHGREGWAWVWASAVTRR